MMDPYNGPAILLPEAAGVFFHEALGHRLEGERQNDNKEGATFKGQIGKPILPGFLTIVDDPTMRKTASGNVSLNGYYRYDDEGVTARPVTLVERGVLRNYLKSRTPVKGSPTSNGHGRADATLDPIGRMGNTIVRSDRRVPYAKLKQMLLAEIRRQNKAFGLIIADISGGQTNTTTYDFQAFKGMPRIVYKVDAGTGKETLVRGVEFVGTPIGSLNRIVAASDADGRVQRLLRRGIGLRAGVHGGPGAADQRDRAAAHPAGDGAPAPPARALEELRSRGMRGRLPGRRPADPDRPLRRRAGRGAPRRPGGGGHRRPGGPHQGRPAGHRRRDPRLRQPGGRGQPQRGPHERRCWRGCRWTCPAPP